MAMDKLMSSEVFTKINPRPGSKMLESERRGLNEIKKYFDIHRLRTPEVLLLDEEQNLMKLQRIRSYSPGKNEWNEFGRGLRKFHSIVNDLFGFQEENHIGLNPQSNSLHENWGEFFYENRLKFQVLIIQDESLQQDLLLQLENKKRSIIDFLNVHNPKASLLHGDLWSGNVMFDKQGPWLIDPAVYYGDCETDIAMTKLFGGFPVEFYRAYNFEDALDQGHEDRGLIYNLYHYLNHFNLFGSGYWAGVAEGFEFIVKL